MRNEGYSTVTSRVAVENWVLEVDPVLKNSTSQSHDSILKPSQQQKQKNTMAAATIYLRSLSNPMDISRGAIAYTSLLYICKKGCVV